MTSLHAGYFSYNLTSVDFLKKYNFFKKKKSRTLSRCHTVSILTAVLIWVHTVCTGYQQTTKAVAMNELSLKFWVMSAYRSLYSYKHVFVILFLVLGNRVMHQEETSLPETPNLPK